MYGKFSFFLTVQHFEGGLKIYTYATYILKNLWIILAALSKRFHSRVELTISNSLRVGNCFLNFELYTTFKNTDTSLSTTDHPKNTYLILKEFLDT